MKMRTFTVFIVWFIACMFFSGGAQVTATTVTSIANGADGESVSNSRRGADGKTGSVTIISGNSSASVHVFTSVNGKIVEDKQYESTDGTPIDETHTIDQDGAHVETHVKAQVNTSTNIKPSKPPVPVSVAPITSHNRSRSETVHDEKHDDKAVSVSTALLLSHASSTSALQTIFSAVTSAITSYVSHIFSLFSS